MVLVWGWGEQAEGQYLGWVSAVVISHHGGREGCCATRHPGTITVSWLWYALWTEQGAEPLPRDWTFCVRRMEGCHLPCHSVSQWQLRLFILVSPNVLLLAIAMAQSGSLIAIHLVLAFRCSQTWQFPYSGPQKVRRPFLAHTGLIGVDKVLWLQWDSVIIHTAPCTLLLGTPDRQMQCAVQQQQDQWGRGSTATGWKVPAPLQPSLPGFHAGLCCQIFPSL